MYSFIRSLVLKRKKLNPGIVTGFLFRGKLTQLIQNL